MIESFKEITGKEKLVDVDEAWVNAQEATRKAMLKKNTLLNLRHPSRSKRLKDYL